MTNPTVNTTYQKVKMHNAQHSQKDGSKWMGKGNAAWVMMWSWARLLDEEKLNQ